VTFVQGRCALDGEEIITLAEADAREHDLCRRRLEIGQAN
jgi:hypothetical protein